MKQQSLVWVFSLFCLSASAGKLVSIACPDASKITASYDCESGLYCWGAPLWRTTYSDCSSSQPKTVAADVTLLNSEVTPVWGWDPDSEEVDVKCHYSTGGQLSFGVFKNCQLTSADHYNCEKAQGW